MLEFEGLIRLIGPDWAVAEITCDNIQIEDCFSGNRIVTSTIQTIECSDVNKISKSFIDSLRYINNLKLLDHIPELQNYIGDSILFNLVYQPFTGGVNCNIVRTSFTEFLNKHQIQMTPVLKPKG